MNIPNVPIAIPVSIVGNALVFFTMKVIEGDTLLMIHDGILKALAGETSIEEVFRVAR